MTTLKRLRKLKIHRKFQARTWRDVVVPEIRLEGKWLEELGFNVGEEVQIEMKRNKLIITPVRKQNEE